MKNNKYIFGLKITLLVFILSFSAMSVFGQNIPIPKDYEPIDSVLGDLDNDGKKELVAAYNTKKEAKIGEGVVRELLIYKMENDQWSVWKKSQEVLLASRAGGAMGDPYSGIEI